MIVTGIIYTSFTSGGDNAVLFLTSGIEKAFELILTLAPIMCFWSGIMRIAEECGITNIISKLLSPLTTLLFGKEYKNTAAVKKISMNMSANMLGMGNAATPLGLDAMQELDRINPNPSVASNIMCMFIIINTASIQLIPTSVIALRAQYGSVAPSSIVLPTLITTLCAFTVGTASAKIMQRTSRHE
ncbi:MAG: spore maturation protein [Clostridia bacterium]|nr:spore maturation protein [Clostridia bacterium]